MNSNTIPLIKRACRACGLALLILMHTATSSADDGNDQRQAPVQSASASAADQSLEALTRSLIKASFSEKKAIAKRISASSNDLKRVVLNALENNQLFYKKSDKDIIVLTPRTEGGYLATSVFSDKTLVLSGKRDVKKIRTNNKLRGDIRGLIAQINIQSDDEDIRLAAAKSILSAPDLIGLAELNERIETEAHSATKDVLVLVKGLKMLQSSNARERVKGIKSFSQSLYPEVRSALTAFIDSFDDDDKRTRKEEFDLANKTLSGIQTLINMNGYAENLYFGLSLGAVLLLAAIGLAITFGVMGVINMAHGEMIMLGAYTTFMVQQLMPNAIEASLFVAIPAAFLISGLVGVIIERTVIRHLYGRPLETLLATFGISLILQQAVRSIFGPLNREVITPQWMAGTFEVNPALALTYNRLYIIIFSLVVLAALALVLKRTLFGLQMRAVTMNRPMASSMGIRTGWVDALTFGLGSGIAGIAGVALSQLTNVGPNLGQAYIIDSFMVVVFGGVGNLWGTLVGAMSLGIANKFFEPFAGAVLAKIMVLIFIILFIQKRPRGLFALKGRAVENG